jgi:small-conductance mechanosensitive channel
MEKLSTIWNYTLLTLSNGNEITLGQALSALLFLALALTLGRHLTRLLSRQLRRSQVDPNAIQTIVRLFYWVFFILVFITALGMLQIPITHLAFISGAVAIGVGFGAQNIINNLISSWILMSEKPVRIGDFIEIDQHMGVVERIGNRSTRIRRIDGVHLLVPNSQMLERVVINWTLVDRRFRSSVRVGVAYGSPVERVAEIMLAAGRTQKEVLSEPPPVVIFEDFGDSALIFDLYFWCDIGTGGELRIIRSGIRFAIERLFNEHGIVIAFPQRDIHFDASKPLEIHLQNGQAAAGAAGENMK